MAFILSVLNGLTIFSKSQVTDDVTDRLHYKLTSGLLIGFAILVSFKQFGGKPIDCLRPSVTGNVDGIEDYAESFCFAQNTYFLPSNEQVKYGDKSQQELESGVSYFKWVPFFLVISAAGFQLPYLLWTFLASHSGIRIHDIVGEARDRKNMDTKLKKDTVKCLRVHLENALRFHRRLERKNYLPHKKLRCLNFPYSACYVTVTYMFVKCLYLLNVLMQFLLLNRFLITGNHYNWYGMGVMSDILHGHSWEATGAFPRVTLCNFEIREPGNNHPYTIQCVLLINMFNEKIFILLWFWYQILTVLSLASIGYWFFATFFPCLNKGFINRHLVLSNMPFDPIASRRDVMKFVQSYLHSDGIFVIRMVEINAGVIFGSDLVCALWKSYYSIEEEVVKQEAIPGYIPENPTAPPLPIYDPEEKRSMFNRSAQSSDVRMAEEGRGLNENSKFWMENKNEFSVSEESEEEDDEDAEGEGRSPMMTPEEGPNPSKGRKLGALNSQEGIQIQVPRSKFNYRQRQGNLIDANDPLAPRREMQEMKKSTVVNQTIKDNHRHNKKL